MSIICPTVTPGSTNPHEFRTQLERVAPLCNRIQIDIMDGEFASPKTLNPVQLWWPEHILADIHMMFRRPTEHIETLVSLKPHLVIIHAEASGDIAGMIHHLQRLGIKVGIALLQSTSVESAKNLIIHADHVLIFSGVLGSFGGKADASLLSKVAEIKAIRGDIEIGWDGGVNQDTVKQLAQGGVDILNVGGFIQRSDNPSVAYEELQALIAG